MKVAKSQENAKKKYISKFNQKFENQERSDTSWEAGERRSRLISLCDKFTLPIACARKHTHTHGTKFLRTRRKYQLPLRRPSFLMIHSLKIIYWMSQKSLKLAFLLLLFVRDTYAKVFKFKLKQQVMSMKQPLTLIFKSYTFEIFICTVSVSYKLYLEKFYSSSDKYS